MENFWKTLPKPFLVLAPLDDVTDVVFREIVSIAARPDVFFTEFSSSDGLFSEGHGMVMQKLRFTTRQRPVVAQIWGKYPENMFKAARLVHELGFDGVDINMGCPDKNVVKKGSGSGLIKTFAVAAEIIKAVRKGAGDIPVSVKTRLGFDRVITKEWITHLLRQKIDVLTVHGRVAVEMSKYPADWKQIGEAVEIRNAVAPSTLIIGNGDVVDYSHALEMHGSYGVDGVMIGRGIFSNPWVFDKTGVNAKRGRQDYLNLLEKHLRLFRKTWGDAKNFAGLRKLLKMYIREFHGSDFLRQKLMACNSIDEMLAALKGFNMEGSGIAQQG